MKTSFSVRKTRFIPSRSRGTSSANSGPRWSMVALDIARSTRAGVLVGPGSWRKWRPLRYVTRRPVGRGRDGPTYTVLHPSTPPHDLDHRRAGRPRARTCSACRDRGRSPLRPLHARPLRNGRFALPDRAPGRGLPSLGGRRRGGARSRTTAGCAGAPTGRRHLAMRADNRPGDRSRLLLAPDSYRGGDGPGWHTDHRRRSRSGSRPPQRPAATARAVVPRRPLDGQPRDPRRYGGKQQRRCPVAPVRHDGRQRRRARDVYSPTGEPYGSARASIRPCRFPRRPRLCAPSTPATRRRSRRGRHGR